MGVPTFTEHLSAGHSYSAAGTASGASSDANTFVQLLQTALGSPSLTRHGRGSAQITARGSVPNGVHAAPTSGYAGQDTVIDFYRHPNGAIAGYNAPAATLPGASRFGGATGLITFAHGLNDLREQTNTPVPSTLKRYKALIAMALCAGFWDDAAAGWSWSGFANNAWTAQNVGAGIRGSNTAGHYGQRLTGASFPGGVLAAFVGAFDSTAGTRLGGSDWRINIDGTTDLADGVDMRAEANATGGGLFTQGVVLGPGAPAGDHLLTVVLDQRTGNSYCDGVGWIIPSTCPTVLVFGQPTLTATGATNGSMQTGYNTRIADFNTGLQAMCAEFQAVGIPVLYVDLSVMNANTSYFHTDQFHPNDTGHAYMKNQALAALEDYYGATFERAVVLTGASAVATAGAFWTTFSRTALLGATGAIATSGHRIVERSAAMTAAATVAATGRRDLLRQAALAAAADVSAAGVTIAVVEGAVAVSATTAVAAEGERDVQRAATVGAAASVAADGFTVVVRSASLSATSGVAATPQRELMRQATVDGTAAVLATGLIEGGFLTIERSASLAATSSVSTGATFWSTIERSTTLAATANVATDGMYWSTVQRSAALAATGNVAATGTFWSLLERSAGVQSTAAVAVNAQRDLLRPVALSATGSLAVAGGRPARHITASTTTRRAGPSEALSERPLTTLEVSNG